MSLSHSDGALKIVDVDEESGFTFFDSSFIETGLSLEELRWKFYEKSVVVGPLLLPRSRTLLLWLWRPIWFVFPSVMLVDRFFPCRRMLQLRLILFHAKELTPILTPIVGLLL
ncbi:unnamed protein product [Lactuca saligna]|uniref:Uncharacterized protein n=1 Tax=Lactuca saligna TaxID=75948 RepID=A0AA35YYX1_LACSI|nr:unnamed protein product [Lactuca saligna]